MGKIDETLANRADSAASSKKNNRDSRRKWLIENVTSLGLALLLVFMVRSSIIEAFKIPSGSMIPTLLVGDHIFVNKFAYGFKVPFTEWFASEPVYIVRRDPPKRGDIVVFKYPKDESLYYIKRVIGTPGDTVELRNKELFVNGQLMKRTPAPQENVKKIEDLLADSTYMRSSIEVFQEDLGYEKPFIMLDNSTYFPSPNFGPITVPPDQYFVMGDNRDASNDSRYWGFVPMKNIRGKAVVIWLSAWISFNPQEFKFRPLRIGTILH